MSNYKFNIRFNKPLKTLDQKLSDFRAEFLSLEDDLELRIYYDKSIRLIDQAFFELLSEINWNNIGNHFEVLDLHHERLLGIDFKESNALEVSSGHTFDEKLKYIAVKIDLIKLIFEPSRSNINCAEFYLNDNGFDLVSKYYSVLWQKNKTTFTVDRMEDMDNTHVINNVKFKPEFNFYSRDTKNKSVSKIYKEPMFKLEFSEITEFSSITQAFKLIALSSSFFYKKEIDFTVAKLFFKDSTTIIRKKNLNLTARKQSSTIWPIYNVHNIDEYFSKIQLNYIDSESLQKLTFMVTKFIQSLDLDIRSSILLRFAILELASNPIKNVSSDLNKKQYFKFTENEKDLTGNSLKRYFETVGESISEKVVGSEKDLFKTKWKNSINRIIEKPSFEPLKDKFLNYFEKIGLETSGLEMEFKEIKKIRDSITHGSVGKYSKEELQVCNIDLYKLSLGLILEQLKVKNWQKDLKYDL